MAKPIDRGTYKLVERQLHREKHCRRLVAAYEANILLGSAGVDWAKPVGSPSGATADIVAHLALRLVDPPLKVGRAQKWLDVIGKAREWFAGSPEGELFLLYYGQSAKIERVAEAMGTNRRGVERMRDNVVYRCAMMAAAEKLIVF